MTLWGEPDRVRMQNMEQLNAYDTTVVQGLNCTMHSRWISWHFLLWELEGITSPCRLLIGQYLHHMTLCPPVAIVYGVHL